MIAYILLLLLLCNLTVCRVVAYNTDVAYTSYGHIRGNLINKEGRLVKEFLGIPFAAPPVNNLRFKAPEQQLAWDRAIYDATYHRNSCMQCVNNQKLIQSIFPNYRNFSEDCLYLNVYTSFDATRSSALHPIIVYFHGGGFSSGSTLVLPHYPLRGYNLARQAVVLVTVQYRLGAFGFLSTGETGSGNYGLLDQLAALKWIRQNIIHFGGDLSRVTLLGHESGAVSTALHILSPKSEGLFHQAILHGGIDLSPWAVHNKQQAQRSTDGLARSLGCHRHSDFLKCLRNKKAIDIANVKRNDLSWPDQLQWAPVVDGIFLPDYPINLRKKTMFSNIRLIAGYSSTDGKWNAQRSLKKAVKLNYTSELNKELFRDYLKQFLQCHNIYAVEDLCKAMQFRYTFWPRPNNSDAIQNELEQFWLDYLYAAPIYKAISIHSKFNSTYWFTFDHSSSRQSADINNEMLKGISYGDDIAYVFGIPFSDDYSYQFTDEDRNISHLVSSMWINFAKHGNPNAGVFRKYVRSTDNFATYTQWERFANSNKKYYQLVARSSKKVQRLSDFEFWFSYFPGFSEPQKDIQSSTHSENNATNRIYIVLTYVMVVVVLFLLLVTIWMSIKSSRNTWIKHRTRFQDASRYAQVPSSTYISYDFYDNHDDASTCQTSVQSLGDTIAISATCTSSL